MLDYFARSVAFRHVRAHAHQNLFAVGVVATSVTLIISLSALIGGMQRRVIHNTTGSIPHIIVRQPERRPLAAWDLAALRQDQPLYVGRAVGLEQRRRKIEDWTQWLPRLEGFDPDVVGVAPLVEGQAFMSREAKRKTVRLFGVVPERFNRIIDIQSNLVAGRFSGFTAGEVVLGQKLADEFGARLGDKVRLLSEDGTSGAYTIAGVFLTGFTALDEGTVYIPLRDAQSLHGLGSAVTSIGIKLARVFEANAIADRLALQIPYEAESWMRKHENLLEALRALAQSTTLILVFTTMAAAFGIVSVLITMVMSRLREIGILKAVGASRWQILGLFALQGAIVAAVGAVMGAAGGVALSLFVQCFREAAAVGRAVAVWPIDLRLAVVLEAMALVVIVSLLASLFPAWRAARVNPIHVIRST